MGNPTDRKPSGGRGQGRGSGSQTRSGRGYSRNKSTANYSSSAKKEQSTGLKFQLHGQKVRQTATYTKVLDHLTVKIQTSFDRPIQIVKSLRNDTKESPPEPTRTRVKVEGTDVEKEEKIFIQQTCDMKFTQEWNSWQKVNGKFEEDWAKTYALIFGTYCTSEMRTAIKEDPNFESVIRDNPMEVLRVIATLMYTPVRARYPFSTLAETISSLFNLR